MKEMGDFEFAYIVARVAEPTDWTRVYETIDGRKHKRISAILKPSQKITKPTSILRKHNI